MSERLGGSSFGEWGSSCASLYNTSRNSFFVLGMVVCFIWIILMRWIAGIIVWLTLFAFVGVFAFSKSYKLPSHMGTELTTIAATYYTFDKWMNMKDSVNGTEGEFIFTTDLSYYTNLSETWLALGWNINNIIDYKLMSILVLGIISAIFLGIFLIIILFLRERICIAVALIKESSR
jgi:choline transporter-like protein 2/4/5